MKKYTTNIEKPKKTMPKPKKTMPKKTTSKKGY